MSSSARTLVPGGEAPGAASAGDGGCAAPDDPLCRRYNRLKLTLELAEIGLPLVMLAGLTFSGGAAALLRYAERADQVAPGGHWAGHLVFLVLLGFITRLTQFPIQLLDEYWIERRFGLSFQSLTSWLWEWFCRSAVCGLVTVVLLELVAETLPWWPLLALPWSILFLLFRPIFYDYIYYPLQAHFYPVRFLRHETFTLPGLGKKTLPVYEVHVSHKTRRVNAAIRLRGPKTAIYVTDTLIDEFTDGEERLVMAHEFGHLYDQLHLETQTRAGIAQAQRKLVLGSAQLLAGLVSLCLLHFLSAPLHLAGVADLRGFPLLAAMTLGLSHAFAPLICQEARRDEQDADKYALAITGDVENYCSVMRKLREINLEEGAANPISRFLFCTHPSYAERVNLARQYRRRHSPRRKSRNWRGWRNIQRHGRR